MTDLGEKLRPVADSVLAPGEELMGCCVATQSSTFKGRMVALVVTRERLVVQGLSRRFEPEGEPLSLTAAQIAEAKVEGGGGGWLEIGAAILDGVSVALKLRTIDGDKLKLLMMKGDGLLGGAGGGKAQRQGVQALGEWFARHADA